MSCVYRRGNIEGNTRSRSSFRKDRKKSAANREEDIVLNLDITGNS